MHMHYTWHIDTHMHMAMLKSVDLPGFNKVILALK